MRTKLVGFALFTALLLACGHKQPPPPPPPCEEPEPVKLLVRASERLNSGEKGESLPTTFRIYQLKDDDKIGQASFEDLLDRDKEVLGDQILAAQELTVGPNEQLTPPMSREPKAAFVAVVALFRRPAGSSWRVVKQLPPPDPQHCHIPAADRDKGKGALVLRLFLEENRVELQ